MNRSCNIYYRTPVPFAWGEIHRWGSQIASRWF